MASGNGGHFNNKFKIKIMKSIFRLSLFLVICTSSANAQNAEDSVKSVITTMFEAMRNADSNSLKLIFAKDVIMQTIAISKEGEPVIRTSKSEDYIKSIATLSKNDADERIVFETVKIDGPMAIVWTPY